jgi:hypothetical protein
MLRQLPSMIPSIAKVARLALVLRERGSLAVGTRNGTWAVRGTGRNPGDDPPPRTSEDLIESDRLGSSLAASRQGKTKYPAIFARIGRFILSHQDKLPFSRICRDAIGSSCLSPRIPAAPPANRPAAPPPSPRHTTA